MSTNIELFNNFCSKSDNDSIDDVMVNSKSPSSVLSHKYRNLVKVSIGAGTWTDRVNTLCHQSNDFHQDLMEVMTMMIFADHFD